MGELNHHLSMRCNEVPCKKKRTICGNWFHCRYRKWSFKIPGGSSQGESNWFKNLIKTSTEGCRWWICFIWAIIQWEYSSFVVHIVFQPVHLLVWKNFRDNKAYRMRVSWIGHLHPFTSCTIYLSIYLSIYRSIYLSITIYLSIYRSIDRSIDRSIYLSIDLSIYLSICLSIDRSIYRSIYLSIDLSIYPSIYLSIYPSSHLHCMAWAQKWLMIAVNISYLIWR